MLACTQEHKRSLHKNVRASQSKVLSCCRQQESEICFSDLGPGLQSLLKVKEALT